MNKNVGLMVGGGGGWGGEKQGLMKNVCGVCDVKGELNPWKEVRLGCLTGQSCVLSE